MGKQCEGPGFDWRGWSLAAVFCLMAAMAAAQQPKAATAPAPPTAKITPEQGRQLFALVDQLIKFSSEETGLPIKSEVKRQITSRAAVEGYLKEKFEDDESAKRMQRGEIVLKKFGLLDRDFNLKPFLLALLKEQIEAYYDFKTKTVYMLDWVDIEEQKPVLAHELTHALQDQHSDLEKWNDQTPDDVSLNSQGDTDHLAKDEMDTAREAVVEGQATAVMMDYVLKPMGKSLVKDPELIETLKQQMSGAQDSPVLARAPLLLSESLLFPYREGLSFEQDIWMDQGQAAAFAGTMDRPPTSSWEIINPREYESKHVPSIPLLPNIHPLVDKLYKPYDIGQMGQLDVHILSEIFGGDEAAANLTPAWDGGLYWAGQRLNAKTPVDQASTNSIAIFYLSVWKNEASAQAFAKLYADELGRKYSGVKLESDTGSGKVEKTFGSSGVSVFATPASASRKSTASDPALPSGEQVYSTNEGPVVITTRGKMVFVAESFPVDVARKLTALVLDAQGTGDVHLAQSAQPGAAVLKSEVLEPLTGNMVRFFSNCGVMKAAVRAAMRTGVTSLTPPGVR
ncbi:MAG: hypothetical protein ABSC76_14425 [Terracidiphilus sp.]|jgi:hypothetical protein